MEIKTGMSKVICTCSLVLATSFDMNIMDFPDFMEMFVIKIKVIHTMATIYICS